MVKVVGTSFDLADLYIARLLLDCGHTVDVDRDDEESLSFVGAETQCDKEHDDE
jgi:hypothetical protein